MPGVKQGSIDDVNAVGHRSIGGRGFGNWYSENTEIAWGSTDRAAGDEVVENRARPGDRGIREPRRPEHREEFRCQGAVHDSSVIDSDEMNAFALPGGYFFVNSGLILAADNEAELAGVMAHEIAHVAAHHQAREMTRMHYADLGMVPLVMLTGYSAVGYGIYEASAFAVPLTISGISARL